MYLAWRALISFLTLLFLSLLLPTNAEEDFVQVNRVRWGRDVGGRDFRDVLIDACVAAGDCCVDWCISSATGNTDVGIQWKVCVIQGWRQRKILINWHSKLSLTPADKDG